MTSHLFLDGLREVEVFSADVSDGVGAVLTGVTTGGPLAPVRLHAQVDAFVCLQVVALFERLATTAVLTHKLLVLLLVVEHLLSSGAHEGAVRLGALEDALTVAL